MRGLAILCQGTYESVMVKEKVGKPPGELGVSKSVESDDFSLQCFDAVGWAT